MTLLVAWAGVDTHGTSSVYIASDSRISWTSVASFDYGRKVFSFSHWPDVLGYCGDVLFPSIALNQIVELADAGLLFTPSFSCKQKFEAIVKKLNDLFQQYPHLHSGMSENSLSIIHASRDSEDNKKFSCYKISWSNRSGWHGDECRMPKSSDVLFVLGTGASEFSANFSRYKAGTNRETSRAVFHCFCDTLAQISDKFVGGAPQVVGIYRKPASPGFTVGIIYNRKRYFLGAHVDNGRNFNAVEWRNVNFERCDGQKMTKLIHAQRQPDPLRRL
jgi:hypothetical protein